MSEEILKALMQLFAIISKQDDGTSIEERAYVERFLQLQLAEDAVQEYLDLFDKFAKVKKGSKKDDENTDAPKKPKLTSVRDSVRTLAICKKINKTLAQEQKIVVLVRLFELINAEKKVTEQRVAIIETAADVFNINKQEYHFIEAFVLSTTPEALDLDSMLIAGDEQPTNLKNAFFITSSNLDGLIIVLRVASVDLYFMRYTGATEINLNGRTINNDRIYLFANGSTIRPAKGQPLYYSDVAAQFITDRNSVNLTFNVKQLEYRFPNGAVGLNEVNISETHGKLIGLMGASGAGKTTLLNVMAGMYKPSSGEVLLNGHNLHEDVASVDGVIGYIPQDDLLIEELTVYQNLYYNAKLCLSKLSDQELNEQVERVLHSLGLKNTSHLKVGSPLDKTISGGQRKRLNIALELIREPSVLFVDEPTSGLSSRDSENVMDLLRELTLKGKVIFVVIHQPSSDIYKMFDKIILLDTGGWQIYYGNPVESLMYFKRIDHQINSFEGECPICGNVNPEQIFNIVEAKVVDDYGQFTDQRKITPQGWHELYKENFERKHRADNNEKAPNSLNRPNKIKQFGIFLMRDLLSKLGNKQYVYLNLLIAPALAFVLSIIIRYTGTDGEYVFYHNDNIPAYIFMCILVAMFIGLTVSAEEIYRDQKILKRESFLNLSRGAYLFSKIAILFGLSALQALLLVLIGNSILEIQGMFGSYWIMLFSLSCFSNVLGLNISSTFNSPVTIYILIPIILIPQMILGGAMFDFDKLNRGLGGEGTVPVLAEFMASRWAYEGLVVEQFKGNAFDRQFYDVEQRISIFDYHSSYYIPELQKRLNNIKDVFPATTDADKLIVKEELALLRNEIKKEQNSGDHPQKLSFTNYEGLQPQVLTGKTIDELEEYLFLLAGQYSGKLNLALNTRETKMSNINQDDFLMMRKKYSNDYLNNIVRKKLADHNFVQKGDELQQVMNPIFTNPIASNALDFRTHFYAPQKELFGKPHTTFWFNLLVLWFMSILLYIALYFDFFKKTLNLFNKFRFNKR